MPHTVRIRRILRAPPARVYRAFLDPEALAKWLPPHGFTGKVHRLEPRVGGHRRMSFTNLGSGHTHAFGGEYLELIEGSKLLYTDRFDDPNLPGETRTAVTLTPVACGTALDIVQEGIPDVIPNEFCYLGWQESVSLLTLLVEPDLPAEA